MTRWVEVVGTGLSVAAMVTAWIGAWFLLVSRPRRVCPGPGRGWAGRVLLCLAPVRSWCGYSLVGLRPDAAGLITCPECGRHGPACGLSGPRRASRWLLLACVLGLAGWSGVHVRWIRQGGWAWSTPTWALLRLESLDSPWVPKSVAHALASRSGDMTQGQRATYANVLLRDLRDDGVRHNAQAGLDRLSALGPIGVDALHRALVSPDWQTRQMAASRLRQAWEEGPRDEPPDPRLLRVSVESLRDDGLLGGHASWTLYTNARDAFGFLHAVGRPALPWLLWAVESDDPQQRVFAAALAAVTGDPDAAERAAPVLVAHLADNSVDRDARTACVALFGMGRRAMTHLTRAVDSADVQQRELARLLWMNLRGERGIHFVDRRVIGRLWSGMYSASRDPCDDAFADVGP